LGADFDVASGWIRKIQAFPFNPTTNHSTGNLFSYTGTDFINSGNDKTNKDNNEKSFTG